MGIAARCLHGAGLCVIPLPTNDHRPYFLRHTSLAIVSTLLISIKIATVGLIALTPAQADLSTITAGRIVQLTNAQRAKAGLNELTTSSLLTTAALQKAQHMLDEDYFAHISPSGVTPWFWMSKVGYTYQVAGENLAIDFIEAEDVVTAWLASPSHKANMLHPDYLETGVGVLTGEFQGGTSTVVVHMFGRPAGAQVASQATTPTPSPTPASTQQPTAIPTASPLPSPAAPTPQPPRVPRIALGSDQSTVQTELAVSIEGDAGSTAHLLVNSQLRASIDIPADGSIQYTVDVSNISDGNLIVRVYASNDTGSQSDLSEPMIITKDTVGPQIAKEELAFLLGPAPDRAIGAVRLPAGSFSGIRIVLPTGTITSDAAASWITLPAPEEAFDIHVLDEVGNETIISGISLKPQFADRGVQEVQVPARFNLFSRRVITTVLVALFILLTLAIFIRIRIQHAGLITHTSLVILLAAALLLL